MENVHVIQGDHSIQFQGYDIWCGTGCDKVLTVVDKLIGAEIILHTFDGETPITGFVIPAEHIPALIRKLIAFSTTGSIAIKAQATTESGA